MLEGNTQTDTTSKQNSTDSQNLIFEIFFVMAQIGGFYSFLKMIFGSLLGIIQFDMLMITVLNAYNQLKSKKSKNNGKSVCTIQCSVFSHNNVFETLSIFALTFLKLKKLMHSRTSNGMSWRIIKIILVYKSMNKRVVPENSEEIKSAENLTQKRLSQFDFRNQQNLENYKSKNMFAHSQIGESKVFKKSRQFELEYNLGDAIYSSCCCIKQNVVLFYILIIFW